MAPTVHLSCLLALLVAGLAQGIKGSLRGQVSVPNFLPCLGLTLAETGLCSYFSEGATETKGMIHMLRPTQGEKRVNRLLP